MTSAGITATSGHGRWFAWAALRVFRRPSPAGDTDVSVPVLTGQPHNSFTGTAEKVLQAGAIGEVHFHQAEPGPRPDDRAWLRALWQLTEPAQAVVELRHLRDPRADRLDTFLIVRTEGTDEWSATAAAAGIRQELAKMMPAGTTADPVISVEELAGIRVPFRPVQQGIVEIHKSMTAARSIRGGAGAHPWLAAVTPWRRDDRTWPPLRQRLAGTNTRLLLSVGLTPYRIGPGLRHHLADRAGMLATLARPGPSSTYSVFGGPRPAEQFAVHAGPLLAEAVGRYTNIAFQVRVSLACDGPLTDHVATTVAEAISPSLPGGGIAGAPAVAVRPSPEELYLAWNNVTGLGFAQLSAAALQGHAPEAIGDLERTLGAIVDIDEAAAAFRLPDATWR